MSKEFITVRIREDIKDKIEYIRCYKSMKEKKLISLNQTIDEIVDEYINNHNLHNKIQ